MRYEHPGDKTEETRRDRNERVGELTPEFDIPEAGEFLWQIFRDAIKSVSRVVDGSYRLIPPTEWQALFQLTSTLVYSREYDILVAMDRVYCDEANKELTDIRSRQEEEAKKRAKNK